MQVDRNKFFELQKRLEIIPFSQSEEWYEHSYEDSTERMRFFVDSLEQPRIMAFGYLRSRHFLGRRLSIEGVSKAVSCTSEHIRLFFKSIMEEGYEIIYLSDIDEYNPDFEVGVRRAGMRRPIGIHLCPMSMIVDLQEPFKFHRNWRRNVKKARENGCTFTMIESPSIEDAQQFVKLFDELRERKSLRYSLSAEKLMPLFVKGRYKMSIIERGGVIICSRISYINNDLIYDVYAANSDEAVSVGAAYLIQEEIFQYFKGQGFNKFDYGRIPPSDGKMDNIYIAKSYSGGRPIGYNGEWEFCNKQWKAYFYSVMAFAVQHLSRY